VFVLALLACLLSLWLGLQRSFLEQKMTHSHKLTRLKTQKEEEEEEETEINRKKRES
jgi:hypothetical protein